MAARRSSFRFRLPWSQDPPSSPLKPASQLSTRPNASTVASPATRPAPSPATRPAAGLQPTSQATSTTNLSTAETPTSNQPPKPTKNTTPQSVTSPTQTRTQNNNQLPNTSATPVPSASNPAGPAPTSTSRESATPGTAGSSVVTKTPVQPSENSPTRATTPQSTTSNPSTPKIAQRPPFRPAGAASSQSPSPKNRVSRNESQSSSPPQATTKSRVTSQPASPSGAATKSRVSQSPSPSRSTPQSPATTPTSSPSRKASQALSRKASQNSSNSPSVANSKIQEKNQANTRPTLPPRSLQEISESSSKSTEALSRIPDKEPVELQTKNEIKSDTTSEGRIMFRDNGMQPSLPKSTLSGNNEGQSKKSDSSSMNGEPKILKDSATDDQETKEVKEVLQESRGKNYGAGEKTIEVQSKQAHIMKVGETSEDHILINPVSNGRQTRTSTFQSRNKIMVAESSRKSTESNEPHSTIHKEIKDNISKVINRVGVGNGKPETEKTPVSVITLAGDNRGASMQLGSDSSTKGRRIHIRRGYKINPDESSNATTDNGERSSKRKRSKDARTMEDHTIAAYINCNVQGINNSIVFNSSITERDPGVHMLIPRMHSEHVQPSEETGKLEAHKAEFSVRPVRRVRRRCLRGLFLESSDSDPDNPDKPRRHGCRVGSKEKTKKTR